MKPVYGLLSAVIALAFFSVSCQRASDEQSSKISIQLPGAMLASGLQVGSQATSVPVSEVIDVEKSKDYLQMTPTGFSSGDYPINCYAVLAAGPEPVFKKNFCGKKNSQNIIQRELEFGSYVALVPSGSSIDFELPAGESRQFYVLGLHAASAASCRDLASKPEKYNLSRPYLIGKSEPVSLKGGTESTVTIGLSVPGANDYFDDCVVADDELQFPLAERIVIEQNTFPFSQLRKHASAGYYCEPIEVALKNFSLSLDSVVGNPATVFSETTARLQMSLTPPQNFVNVLSYDTASDCYADTNVKDGFSFLRNDTKKVRWIKIDVAAVTGDRSYRSVFDNGSLTSTSSSFRVTMDISSPYFDYQLPRKVRPDKCYEIKTHFRNLNGEPAAIAASADVTLSTVPAGSASFYFTGNECETNTNPISASITIPTGTNTATYFMRTNSVSQEYLFRAVDNTNNIKTLVGDAKVRYPFAATSLVKNTTSITSLRFKGKTYAPNLDSCQELTVYLVNDEGTSLHTGAAGGTLKLLTDASAMANTLLYSDSSCSNPVNSGNPNVSVTSGKYAVSLYMKVSASTTAFGPRHMQFSFSESASQPAALGRFDYYVTKASFIP